MRSAAREKGRLRAGQIHAGSNEARTASRWISVWRRARGAGRERLDGSRNHRRHCRKRSTLSCASIHALTYKTPWRPRSPYRSPQRNRCTFATRAAPRAQRRPDRRDAKIYSLSRSLFGSPNTSQRCLLVKLSQFGTYEGRAGVRKSSDEARPDARLPMKSALFDRPNGRRTSGAIVAAYCGRSPKTHARSSSDAIRAPICSCFGVYSRAGVLLAGAWLSDLGNGQK